MKKATIITTDSMSPDTFAYICSCTEKKFGQKFDFEQVIDNSIVGGFIIQIDNEVFDQSCKTKLEQFRHYLSV